MSAVPVTSPDRIGIEPRRLQAIHALLQAWVDADKVPAAAFCLGRQGHMAPPLFLGRHRPQTDSPPLQPDALFPVTSLTKPVVALAVLMLVERGVLTLQDPVADFVPAFAANGKQEVLIRHLLTHTSGLPSLPPRNVVLRKAHQPLAVFVEETCKLPLLFAPGTQVRYQSLGFLMLGEIVRQATGRPLPEFLRTDLFQPLGLADTSLGWQPDQRERLVTLRLAAEYQDADWHWNSPYWLASGSPSSGLITSLTDFAALCQFMLNGGTLASVRLLSPAAVRAMTTNQLALMPQVPEEDRRCRPWGLGWRLNWPGHAETFGDLLGPRAYGHRGASGVVCWIDPDAEAFCVLFTTQALDRDDRFLIRVGNMAAAALGTAVAPPAP